MATLNIKDPEVHELANELATRTHQSLTQAVRQSLRESLARHTSGLTDNQRILDTVLRIGQSIATLPVLDARTPEEILGYNDFGLPE